MAVEPRAAARARRRRSFYRGALTEAERADLPIALEMEGITEEIAALRLRLRTAIKDHPEDTELMLKGMNTLARLVSARYRLGEEAAAAVVEGLWQEIKALVQAVEEEGGGR